jgi:hypothetical protein
MGIQIGSVVADVDEGLRYMPEGGKAKLVKADSIMIFLI